MPIFRENADLQALNQLRGNLGYKPYAKMDADTAQGFGALIGNYQNLKKQKMVAEEQGRPEDFRLEGTGYDVVGGDNMKHMPAAADLSRKGNHNASAQYVDKDGNTIGDAFSQQGDADNPTVPEYHIPDAKKKVVPGEPVLPPWPPKFGPNQSLKPPHRPIDDTKVRIGGPITRGIMDRAERGEFDKHGVLPSELPNEDTGRIPKKNILGDIMDKMWKKYGIFGAEEGQPHQDQPAPGTVADPAAAPPSALPQQPPSRELPGSDINPGRPPMNGPIMPSRPPLPGAEPPITFEPQNQPSNPVIPANPPQQPATPPSTPGANPTTPPSTPGANPTTPPSTPPVTSQPPAAPTSPPTQANPGQAAAPSQQGRRSKGVASAADAQALSEEELDAQSFYADDDTKSANAKNLEKKLLNAERARRMGEQWKKGTMGKALGVVTTPKPDDGTPKDNQGNPIPPGIDPEMVKRAEADPETERISYVKDEKGNFIGMRIIKKRQMTPGEIEARDNRAKWAKEAAEEAAKNIGIK